MSCESRLGRKDASRAKELGIKLSFRWKSFASVIQLNAAPRASPSEREKFVSPPIYHPVQTKKTLGLSSFQPPDPRSNTTRNPRSTGTFPSVITDCSPAQTR